MKIDELLTENTKLLAQTNIKPKEQKTKPNFYNTFSHFPKFKDPSQTPPSNNENNKFFGPLKKTSLNKSLTSYPVDEKTQKVEEELKRNSEDIEKLKNELRFIFLNSIFK